jgi:hypothetical protein
MTLLADVFALARGFRKVMTCVAACAALHGIEAVNYSTWKSNKIYDDNHY